MMGEHQHMKKQVAAAVKEEDEEEQATDIAFFYSKQLTEG